MADEEIKLPTSFNLGIENSAIYGNMQDAESFLSTTETVLPKTEVKKIEETPKEKDVPKKEVPKQNNTQELVENFLGEEENDEEEGKEDKKKTIKDVIKEENNSELGEFESFSSELYKLGILTPPESGDPVLAKTGEDLRDLLNEEKRNGATAWLEGFLGRFGEDRNELFEAIFVNGVDPREYLPTFNEILNFEGLDLENESNQEKVVRTFYKQSGWTDAKIDAKVEKLKSYADLEEEAKTIHPMLLEQKKVELADKSEAKAEEQKRVVAADAIYKESITKILSDKLKDKNIDGIPLTDKDAKKAFDFLYLKKWKTASGELLTDFDAFILDSKKPENHAIRIKIALLAENKFDLSKIEKKVISKESNEVFSSLVHKKEKKNTPVANRW